MVIPKRSILRSRPDIAFVVCGDGVMNRNSNPRDRPANICFMPLQPWACSDSRVADIICAQSRRRRLVFLRN